MVSRLYEISFEFEHPGLSCIWKRSTTCKIGTLHNSLFTFLLSKARQAKTGYMEMKISQPIFVILVVLTKKTLRKYVMSRAYMGHSHTYDVRFLGRQSLSHRKGYHIHIGIVTLLWVSGKFLMSRPLKRS